MEERIREVLCGSFKLGSNTDSTMLELERKQDTIQ